MKRYQSLIMIFIVIFLWLGIVFLVFANQAENNYIQLDENITGKELSDIERFLSAKYPDMQNWQRPDGPWKVGLQAGHWLKEEMPDELSHIRDSDNGAYGGGKEEWEVNLDIAQKTAEILRNHNIEADVLPATVPPAYYADLFLAIHADGNPDTRASGFKASPPWQDLTHKADQFVKIFYQIYGQTTDLPEDPNITEDMRGYYAFNWFRSEHAIHPMTTAAIIEPGFLTNPLEQDLLINHSDLIAQGIASSVLKFFNY